MSVPAGVETSVVGNLVAGVSVFVCMVGFFCGSFVGKSVLGKFVDGSSVGDWLVGTDCGCLVGTVVVVFCGINIGDEVGPFVGFCIGCFFGRSVEGKLVVGALKGDWLVGIECG